ncbi:hypothetical protein Q5752_007009 [Cryptotrichosporon argae]
MEPPLREGKARITCFWSWNPKGAWAVGGGVPQHLPSVMVGLVDYVRAESSRVPLLRAWGSDVTIGSVGYDTSRVTLSVGYAIVDEGEDDSRRHIEFGLSSAEGWDVQIQVKMQSGEASPSTAWTSFVGRASSGRDLDRQIVLRFAHARLRASEELVRVKVTLERTTASSVPSIRINGIPATIERMSPLTPRRPLLEETASVSGVSVQTFSTLDSAKRDASVERVQSGRPPAMERNIASLIRRNYIYFTSLLQEPEQKWRPVADSKGVAVHQLNSIDKTLVVFRAEAMFVGVGVWDLFATIANPGCRYVWEKSCDESTLLEDVNELTDLWHTKSKAAWPIAARDSVLLRTTYKSPSSVHIFGFSVDNADLFPTIPPVTDPAVIRTQIDLQGWSIEALSPNTTQVTLLEQSDPRGWSNKSSIPQVMMNTLAGIGDFAIKHGAPPVATRLGGAKAVYSKYDVEKETFRFEYQSAEERRSNSSSTATAFPLPVAVRDADTQGESSSLKSLGIGGVSNIECEIRCDDQWAGNLAITIEPPAQSVSTLKRHRLSPNGGGLWLTIEHDPVKLADSKAVITIRRGGTSTSGKVVITVNGNKLKVDTEELSEADVQVLKKTKRSKPTRIPLDQPPALGTIRKKQSKPALHAPVSAVVDPLKIITPTSSFARFAMPLSRWYSAAAESTKAVIAPAAMPTSATMVGSTPVDAASRALGRLVRIHHDRDGESTDPVGWQPVSDRDGLKIERQTLAHVSETFSVFRAGRILEGFTAEEVSAAVSMLRNTESFGKSTRLQSHGYGIVTSHAVAHATFPFKDRSALLATIVARVPDASVAAHAPISTIFHATSSSFDSSTLAVDPSKYNPASLPTCNVILEGWILETIDPYSHEQYAIPSTRCVYVGAVDYSGSMPISVNNMLNASLPRALLAVEAKLKTAGPPSRVRIPPMAVFVPDATASGPWALANADKDKQPIDNVNDNHEFKLTVAIQPSAKSSIDEVLTPPLRHHESKVSVMSNRTAVINLAEDIRRGKHDLLVAEVDLASELVKNGCEVEIRGLSLPAAYWRTGNEAVLPFDPAGDHVVLPFKCTVLALAPSVMQSASLDPTTAARHLLRVTLPTSGYEAPVNDPLTGKQGGPLPRPRWLLDLINDGAVIQMRLTSKKAQPATYTFAGDVIAVEDEKKLSGRNVPKDPSKIKLPQLVSAGTPGVTSLDKPLAVATEFLPNIAIVSADQAVADVAVDDDAAKTELDSVAPSEVKAEPVAPPLSPLPLRSNRYNFWKYGPLNRFNLTAQTIVGTSPVLAHANKPVSPHPEIAEAAPVVEVDMRSDAVRDLLRPAVPLSVLVAACLACLLLGSLLRSFLSDADFVIYQSAGTRVPRGQTWRELKRLGEWRIGFDRDLIVAVARRQ